MSAKGSKRRQRRVNTTEEDTDKKNEDIVDISDDNKSTVSTDNEKSPKESTLKDIKELEEEAKEDKKENGDKTPPRASPKTSPKTSPNKIETVENGQKEDKKEDNKSDNKDNKSDKKEENKPGKKEDNKSDKKEENKSVKKEEKKTDSPKNEEKTNGQENGSSAHPSKAQEEIEEMEPLILIDTEEQELQFPSETGSETSEIEKSPILNRCQTRRSHTRNQPTPKTPKSLDFEEEKPKNPMNDLRVNITRLQPTPEVTEEEEKSENVSVISTENESSFSEKTQDTDITNASVFAIFGDTTRNIDITTNFDDSTINTSNISSFIDLTKEKSYGETLRCLTGRKTVRRNDAYKPRFYSSNLELTSKDLTDASKNYSPRIGATKRKLDQDSPSEYKKPKIDDSPGILAYISSPFKYIVGRTGIPGSTPKLTGFKYSHQGSNPIDEVEKIGVELSEEKKVEPKKGCEIM